MFEKLREELEQDKKMWRDKIIARIENDGDEMSATRGYCTDTRWQQWRDGQITADQLKRYTIKRVEKGIEKHFDKKEAKLDRTAQAPELIDVAVVVEYSTSHNPTATCDIHDADKYQHTSGHAAGWGYDKESAAVAEALNKSDSVLKALYSLKEARLRQGLTDTSTGACTGRDNRNIIAYGAGYDTLPYFEGAVGVNCFWNIFNLMGFKVRCNYTGQRTNFYMITKDESK